MKFIGNKYRLLDFIDNVINKESIEGPTVCDPFSGTTAVAQYFKRKGHRVIANDIMFFSYVFQRAFIECNRYPDFSKLIPTLPSFEDRPPETIRLRELSTDFPGPFRREYEPLWRVINHLNRLPPRSGFVYQNYSLGGTLSKKHKRQYFSDSNAMRIDAIRDCIQNWLATGLIDEEEFYVLLAALLDSADFVANNSGTYGAFLKIWRSMALKPLALKVLRLIPSDREHEAHQEDANELVRHTRCDILYLDPPYNTRQYATNYHLLETIAKWDNPRIYGKTGLRPYASQKSDYSVKSKCEKAFADLIDHAECSHILMSYNDEGIIPHGVIEAVLGGVGRLRVYERRYKRFRSESDHPGRTYKKKGDVVIERLYSVRL